MSVRILEGDALTVLRTLPDCSVQMCCTSPPYFGLRDYGVVGQLGLEKTPELYVEAMVGVFAEVKRVLRDDGTLWLNIGDSYAGGAGGRGDSGNLIDGRPTSAKHNGARIKRNAGSLKPKNLIGIPWLLAFALRAEGWYLRAENIWEKPNPMPSSVTDRTTRAHEHVFHLAKSERYYYDAVAIAEPAMPENAIRYSKPFTGSNDALLKPGGTRTHPKGMREWKATRNARSVWTITTQPFAGAHFATMPPELAEKCIRAGSKEGDTILDPFSGAGTTALVADRLGRDAIGIEINPEYAALSRNRIHSDNPLFGDVA